MTYDPIRRLDPRRCEAEQFSFALLKDIAALAVDCVAEKPRSTNELEHLEWSPHSRPRVPDSKT